MRVTLLSREILHESPDRVRRLDIAIAALGSLGFLIAERSERRHPVAAAVDAVELQARALAAVGPLEEPDAGPVGRLAVRDVLLVLLGAAVLRSPVLQRLGH